MCVCKRVPEILTESGGAERLGGFDRMMDRSPSAGHGRREELDVGWGRKKGQTAVQEG